VPGRSKFCFECCMCVCVVEWSLERDFDLQSQDSGGVSSLDSCLDCV
jgi:hypothetical protein